MTFLSQVHTAESWIYSIEERYRWVVAKVGHTWKTRSVTSIKEFQSSTARRFVGKFDHAPHRRFFFPSHGKRSWIDGGRCRERRGVGDRRNMCAKSRQTLTQPGIILLERHDVAPSYPSPFLRRLRMPARGKRRISRDITIRRYVRGNNFSRIRVFHKGSPSHVWRCRFLCSRDPATAERLRFDKLNCAPRVASLYLLATAKFASYNGYTFAHRALTCAAYASLFRIIRDLFTECYIARCIIFASTLCRTDNGDR